MSRYTINLKKPKITYENTYITIKINEVVESDKILDDIIGIYANENVLKVSKELRHNYSKENLKFISGNFEDFRAIEKVISRALYRAYVLSKKKIGKKVESEDDFISGKYYTTKTSVSNWEFVCVGDGDEVILHSDNCPPVSKRFKKSAFIKNWYFAK